MWTGKTYSTNEVRRHCAQKGQRLLAHNGPELVVLCLNCKKERKRYRVAVFRGKKYCGVCNDSAKKDWEAVKTHVSELNGSLLKPLPVYQNVNTKIRIRCQEGHEFDSTRRQLLNNGQWCSECARGVGERVCRAYFEGFTGKKFAPLFLKSKGARGGNLSLDGYNKILNLGFEFNGRYHNSNSQKKIDALKRAAARRELPGIKYIEIPDPRSARRIEEIGGLVRNALKKNGIPIVRNTVSIDKSHIYTSSLRIMEGRLVKLLEQHSFSLIFDYMGTKEKVALQHICGFQFERSPEHLMRGQLTCPKCAPGVLRDKRKVKWETVLYEKGYRLKSISLSNGRTRFVVSCRRCKEQKIVRSDYIRDLVTCNH